MDGQRLGGLGLRAGIGQIEPGLQHHGRLRMDVALGSLPPSHLLDPPDPHLRTCRAHVLCAPEGAGLGPASPALGADWGTAPYGRRRPYLLTVRHPRGIDLRASR